MVFKIENIYICTAGGLIAFLKRKVRTPKSGIAGNARHCMINTGGQVQQKVCTDNAVVKPGKLYAVKCHVYQSLSN